jgi:hypothetical protein
MEQMSTEAAIVSVLQDSTVRALIGNRVYPEQVPEGKALPAATYMEVNGNDQGLTNSGLTGLNKSRYQLTIQDTDARSVISIRDAIVSVFRATRYATHANLLIEKIHVLNTGSLPSLDTSSTLHGKYIDFMIYIKES